MMGAGPHAVGGRHARRAHAAMGRLERYARGGSRARDVCGSGAMRSPHTRSKEHGDDCKHMVSEAALQVEAATAEAR